MGQSCGVVCVILRLAVLIQYRSVTDTDTQTHTHRHTTTAYTALSKASRGKNEALLEKKFTSYNKVINFNLDHQNCDYFVCIHENSCNLYSCCLC